ncbi:MAG TPA: putative Ig domain-containing protein [Thermoanaerobaculia bacterium]|nr:putative Ig domain-containing protein [Thermoanaerobaculia bacterium]
MLTLVVTNAQGCSAQNSVNVPINPIPAFTPAAGALSVATFNVAYSLTFAGTGGTAPYTFVLASGALPTGMTLNSNGSVSPNTPSATGAFAFSITVTDANGCSSTQTYTLNVQPNLGTDAYSGVGNTQFFITGVAGAPTTPAVSSATTVLANDTPGGIAVTAGTTACLGIGGSITMDTVGRFIYTPPVGLTGIANCTYTGTSNTIAATGAINITLTNMVWWVDNATPSGTNDGRSNTPFKTMTAVNGAATNNGDFIYVFKGSGTTTGAYTMKPSQQIIGAGATLNVPTISPLVTIAGVDGNTPTIGGTITLAGNVTVAGIDMNTDASNGIAGTSVSGVTVTVRNVATTTGTGVTIGGSGNSGTFLFKSIASNGAVNGISLTNTTGSFTVTGDGASDPADTTRGRTTAKQGGGSITLGSGGTIQNTTGPAISLTTATNVTLRNVSLTGNAGGVNSGADGIHAQSVTGLTLDNVLVIGHLGNDGLFGSGVSGLALQHVDIHSNAKTAGVDALDIWNVRLDNLTGTSTAANSLFFDSLEDIFTISNNNSTLTMTVTNSEFRDTSLAGSGNTAFAMIASGSSVTTITATGSTFKNAKTTGFQYAGNNTSSGTVKVMNSIFGGTAAGGDAANQNGVDVDIAHQGAGTTLNFEVSGNTMRQGFRANDSTSINIFLGGLSTAGTQMIGTVKNNVVGIAGTANSGSDLGAGIALDTTGAGTLTASVTGNSVNQVRANSGNVFDAGIAGTSKLDLFLHNNVFNGNPAQVNPQYGLHINNGTGTPGETSQLCLDMGANTVTMPASAIASIDLDAFGGTTSNLVGYAGAANNAAQIQAFFTSVNTSTTPATLATLAGGTVQGSAGCGVTFPSIVSLGNETQ